MTNKLRQIQSWDGSGKNLTGPSPVEIETAPGSGKFKRWGKRKPKPKPWRGTQDNFAGGCVIDTMRFYGTEREKDCTVVPDACNFPVKEAMALIKAVNAVYESHPLTEDHLLTAADEAHDKYLRAVKRMKERRK